MKGFLPWRGGKSVLAKQIVEHIDSIPHSCYVEPFSGGAHVFFRRKPIKVEVLNDINGELINLFRVIKNRHDEFIDGLKWSLVSCEEFELYKKTNPDTLTEMQRAIRFYYLQKLCFGGRLSLSFGTRTTSPPRLNLNTAPKQLVRVHKRLAQTYIENEGWAKCIERYDRMHTLFYIDPPYYGHTEDYGKDIFNHACFVELAKILSEIKGKFILSLNDVPAIRNIFKEFFIKSVDTKYSCSRDKTIPSTIKEILISNTELAGEMNR